MRITNRAMNNNLLLNLNRSLGRLDKLNNQLGSKKQINVPSDDPVKAGVILRMNTSVRETEQYIRNAESADSWLDASDIVFQDVIQVIHRVKELANRGASTHLDQTSRDALAEEVYQLHDNLLQLANSTHGGRYIFAGQKTQTLPFEIDETTIEDGKLPEIIFKGDQGSIEFEIGVNVTMAVNMQGKEIFEDVFSVLGEVYADLKSGNSTDSGIGKLDKSLDMVLQHVSQLGGKQNRIELAQERLKDLSLNLKKIRSEAEDLDYSEAIMNLKMEEFAYRTALSVGARIIQPSLIDFLR